MKGLSLNIRYYKNGKCEIQKLINVFYIYPRIFPLKNLSNMKRFYDHFLDHSGTDQEYLFLKSLQYSCLL